MDAVKTRTGGGERTGWVADTGVRPTGRCNAGGGDAAEGDAAAANTTRDSSDCGCEDGKEAHHNNEHKHGLTVIEHEQHSVMHDAHICRE